jgi:hypothetical protein
MKKMRILTTADIKNFSLPLGREKGERGREKVYVFSLSPPLYLYRGKRERERKTGKIIDNRVFIN